MLEIKLYPKVNYSERAVEDFAAKRALILSLKGTLKTKVGNTHYHFKRKNERGVLEVTIFTDTLQLNVHDNRQGPWIDNELLAWQNEFN